MTITSKHEWGSIVRGFETRCTSGGARERSSLFNSQKATGQVLGAFEHTEYRTGRCGVVLGDLIMLFTDRLSEAEIAKDDYYGEERFAAAVRQRIGIPAEELLAQVLDEIRQACVEKEFGDDVCLLGVEVVRIGAAEHAREVA